jgi:hypothetical protein
MSGGDAASLAAKVAWTKLKQMGAQTKKDTLGNRKVYIMRDTERLMNSLEPSSASPYGYRPRKEQLFKVNANTISIGSLVPYERYHRNTRPVLPDNITPWVQQAGEVAMNAVMDHIYHNVL